MMENTAQPCLHHDLIVALVRGELSGDEQRAAEALLQRDESCRAVFRAHTLEKFPDFPDYTIIKRVGRGGFGLVFKAVQHTKERIEAIKLHTNQTPQIKSYFENEVHLIANLKHPNIATLYEAHLDKPPLYYTMEFVDGERLNDYVSRQKASLAERLEIVRTVALAIQYAHEQGVIHRDIKPQNILIDSEGAPRIVDFGIAKRLGLTDSEADGEGPVGTLGYISPEQAGGGQVDARADVFALGALLFHCVTGEPARLARSPSRRLQLLREHRVSHAEDLSTIIGHCVEKDPQARYQSCTELADDLTNYLAGKRIIARAHASLSYRASRIASFVVRTYPLPLRTAVVASVAAVLAVCFWGLGADALADHKPTRETVVIAFGDSTLAALRAGRIGADLPGLSPLNKRSWRLLHGRLMERLAQAAPRVVAWDYYFPKCAPEFDPAFVRGVQALAAPVVVGAARLDTDGVPEVCETIGAATHARGTMVSPQTDRTLNEYFVIHCLERGFDAPVPSLAVATFAAMRFPDCTVVPHLEPSDQHVELRYRRKAVQRGEARWQAKVDLLPLHEVITVTERDRRYLSVCRPGDRLAMARVVARPAAEWFANAIPYEDVLTAEPQQLRAWFDGRPVLIGQMISGIDEHQNGRHERIFGCLVHAEALDALIAGLHQARFTRPAIAIRSFLWCAVAGIAVSLLPRRRPRSLVPLTVAAAVLSIVGLGVLAFTARFVNQPWQVETGLAASCLLIAGVLVLIAKAAYEREVQLTPAAVTPAATDSTVPSTALAETR